MSHRFSAISSPIQALLACTLLVAAMPAIASVKAFTDSAIFEAESGATALAETYEGSVRKAANSSAPAPAVKALGKSSLVAGHYTHRFDGPDLSVSGLSQFTVIFEQAQVAAGFELEDPRADSVFSVELFRNGRIVGRAAFGPHDNQVPGITALKGTFAGVTSDRGFDEMRVREIHGRGDEDPEYFGRFYGSAQKSSMEKDNVAAIACQIPAGAAYNFLFPIALIPNPFSLPADLSAYSANLLLKACQSVIVTPDDITITPPSPGVCSYEFDAPRMVYNYNNLLGIPLGYDWNWGDFGTPTVVHHNTAADIQMLMRGMPSLPHARSINLDDLFGSTNNSSDIWDGCSSSGNGPAFSRSGYACPFQQDRTVNIPIGRNTITWRSEARASIMDLIWVYIPGVPSGWKNAKVINKTITVINFVLDIAETATGAAIDGWRFGNVHDEYQNVVIHDIAPPRVDVSIPPKYRPGFEEFQSIEATRQGDLVRVKIQADEIGGVSRSRYEARLRTGGGFVGIVEGRDACDTEPGSTREGRLSPDYPDPDLRAFWPVITEAEDTSFEITWTATDPGPNPQGGSNLSEPVRMEIRVVDEQPPAIVAPPDIVEVGTSQVDELGQPLVFDFVDLNPTVTNDANLPLGLGVHFVTWTARDASGNEATATQLVNVKSTNVPPTAVAQTGGNRADAVSFEPTLLTLRGSDPDGDPLSFFIDEYPQNGFFVAPLYPYFVEDYRLEATQSDDAIQARCDQLWEDRLGNRFELEEPRAPNFVSVTDGGRTYVQDTGSILCRNDLNLDFQGGRRIAVFDENGALLNAFEFIPELDDFYVDYRTDRIYTTVRGSSSGGFGGNVTEYDLDMNRLRRWRLSSVPGLNDMQDVRSAVLDSNGVLYVWGRRGDLEAFDANGPVGDGERVDLVYLGNLLDRVGSQSEGISLAIDSEDNIYVSSSRRIYKFTGSSIDSDGNVQLGDFVGWLGACQADFAPGDLAVCDVANERSLGFSCTDETCGSSFSGSGPGQFDGARGIAMDPNDVLYVTDFDNFRVQRFTSDGFFAGQAESTCDGSCFVLGDFGRPDDISVNSDRFYILNSVTQLVHVSQTTPFLEIGEDYATVEYQSDNDFACLLSGDCVDQFSFTTSDGVRSPDTMQPIRSAPATVEVEVRRNFRPPFATPGIAELILEDTPTALTLDGSDPDPLDSLSYQITAQPSHGTLSLLGNQATYTPDRDFFGSDSFAYRVSDGNATSASEDVLISVENINDAPSIQGESSLRVGAGFRAQISAEFTDPDPEGAHLVRIEWGDGSAENEGSVTSDGETTGPVLSEATDGATGKVSASHIYTSTGNFEARVIVWDNVIVDDDGNKSIDPQLSARSEYPVQVQVLDLVDLAISSQESAEPVTPGQSLTYEFEVANLEPEGSGGSSATGVSLLINLDSSLELVTTIPSCSQANDGELSCPIGTLNVGQSATFSVVTTVSPSATAGTLLQTEAEVVLNEFDQSDINEIVETTPISRPADFFVGASGDGLYDEPDASPGDGVCSTASDVCTLRAAIEEANASSGLNTIALGNGNYVLGLDSSGAKGASGELVVTDNLIVLGNGAENTFVDGNGESRLFRATSGTVLRLDGLTLAGGSTDTNGGALLAQGDNQITLKDVHVTNNQASQGGGLSVSGELTLESVTFSGNVATGVGGGGLWQSGDSSLTNVTFSGNRASNLAGGLLLAEGGHSLTNVTVAGNSSGGEGGGIGLAATLVDATMVNSIVAGNRAQAAGAECYGIGGSQLTSRGHNFIGDNAQCDITTIGSDRSGSLELRPLQINQRGTPTLAPQPNSPVLDRGNNAACPAKDQRGVNRPKDGDNNGSSICDVGAFEARFVADYDRIFRTTFE